MVGQPVLLLLTGLSGIAFGIAVARSGYVSTRKGHMRREMAGCCLVWSPSASALALPS